ncbi:tRNA uridine-5-carboxymethylaminomethyl(34) synthesis GTPase MnmE [Parvularcula sp. LCG005]|uniref:tRNA uridine-5-carboxymethylaminomethyl(34) synthesis GTPase MnmE n=1 Tax=Parvularcula sp. LCG005 TaxID=3078805 RepID=UPI0029423244|nr:tRNA uridine-5-carboxymethylaminomethyl(34) synthesis GTPase MnmE [Parvularcula sp. LCG005]WOI53305.1 tRNA uridine-5-carboxymethylaminomethyl(34) synthesis GTPase MnmE [Parvularcula sp. LCG005]
MSTGSDTIFARSSGQGRAGIAVWRVSGPMACRAVETLAGKVPPPRRAAYRQVFTASGEQLDDGIVLYFPGPHSATGEDLAEFHLHGSPAVSHRFAEELTSLGLRAAAAGEFTQRAFLNGRMDLLAIEGLGDLLDAETEAQRQQAMVVAGGGVRERIASWRRSLISALAVLEAAVDFPDEEDIPADIAARAFPILYSIREEMQTALAASDGAQRLKEGINLAIIGPPNAGKSSLLNKLAGEERAIVSDIAGTTRDIVSIRIDIAGRLVNVLDTAGLREGSEDPIEREGMTRAAATAQMADIVIALRDGTAPQVNEWPTTSGLVIRVANKSDKGFDQTDELAISLANGEGWDQLMTQLEAAVRAQASPSFFPRERQQMLVRNAAGRIEHMLQSPHLEPELLSEDLRACIRALDDLVGQSTTEDVLGTIFSSFCIGK